MPSPSISAALINLIDAVAERVREDGFGAFHSSKAENPSPNRASTDASAAENTSGTPDANSQRNTAASDNPALNLQPEDLQGFAELPEARQAVVRRALELVNEHGGLPYTYGGDSPEAGGFDCSGFVHCLLHGLDPALEPPRSSAAQFAWLEDAGELHPRTTPIDDLEDDFFDDLEPGDLLFWAGTYQPGEERENDITHVGVYLGREKDGNRPVMANSSSGRSYHGQRQEGLSVVDFALPQQGRSSRFRGYGSPVGLEEE